MICDIRVFWIDGFFLKFFLNISNILINLNDVICLNEKIWLIMISDSFLNNECYMFLGYFMYVSMV